MSRMGLLIRGSQLWANHCLLPNRCSILPPNHSRKLWQGHGREVHHQQPRCQGGDQFICPLPPFLDCSLPTSGLVGNFTTKLLSLVGLDRPKQRVIQRGQLVPLPGRDAPEMGPKQLELSNSCSKGCQLRMCNFLLF